MQISIVMLIFLLFSDQISGGGSLWGGQSLGRANCLKRAPLSKKATPCIMCVQYRGGCSVPWGVLSTVGGVQYRGGNHEYCGGIS